MDQKRSLYIAKTLYTISMWRRWQSQVGVMPEFPKDIEYPSVLIF